MKSILLSLMLVSSIAVASEVKQDEVVLSDNTTFAGQVLQQAGALVEQTVNLIATPFLSDKDVDCMARNIFYEAGGESREGKIAVAQVTLNRAQDPRFGRSVCEVVKARTHVARTREVKKVEVVETGFFGRPHAVEKKETVIKQVPVCQFSWVCGGYVKKPKDTDERWIESKEIAEAIARGELQEERAKYSKAVYFHAAGIRPVWAKSKAYLKRTGHHLFYGEVDK